MLTFWTPCSKYTMSSAEPFNYKIQASVKQTCTSHIASKLFKRPLNCAENYYVNIQILEPIFSLKKTPIRKTLHIITIQYIFFIFSISYIYSPAVICVNSYIYSYSFSSDFSIQYHKIKLPSLVKSIRAYNTNVVSEIPDLLKRLTWNVRILKPMSERDEYNI